MGLQYFYPITLQNHCNIITLIKHVAMCEYCNTTRTSNHEAMAQTYMTRQHALVIQVLEGNILFMMTCRKLHISMRSAFFPFIGALLHASYSFNSVALIFYC